MPPAGFETTNPSKRAAADPCLRPRGQRNRLLKELTASNCFRSSHPQRLESSKHGIFQNNMQKSQYSLNIVNPILCFVDRASLYSLFQMKPTRCTLILSIFISPSLHVSGNYVPIIRSIYCIYATLVFFTVYGWLSGLLVGMGLIPTSRPESHP